MKTKEVDNIQGGGRKFLGPFKRHFGVRYHCRQWKLELIQCSSKFSIANEAENNTQQNASFIVSLHYSMHILSH